MTDPSRLGPLPPGLARPVRWYGCAGTLANRYAAPVLDLCLRLYIARVFFRAGLQKIQDWQATLFLFEYEYMVPVLPVDAAATLATMTELAMPVFLALGLLTRAAAVPGLVMACVIQFHLGAVNPAYDSWEHYLWIVVFLSLILKGPGVLSLDHLLCRWLTRRPETV